MRTTLAITLVTLLALAGGCGQDKKNEAASAGEPQAQVATKAATLTPEELGELGAKIRKTPERSNELLQERGLTEKTFEAEIRKVTEDPEASKKYAAAYKRASA